MTVKQVFSAYDHQQLPGEQEGHFRFCPHCGGQLQLRQIAGRERSCCMACGFIQFRNPLPAVAVMVTDRDRILLGRRRNELEEDRWCMPCGFIEHDEDFLTAARREVKEETGLDIRPVELINVAFNFLTPTIHTLVPVIRAEVLGGSLQADDDMAEVGWFGPEDPLPPLAFESDMYIIDRYRRGLVQPMPVEG